MDKLNYLAYPYIYSIVIHPDETIIQIARGLHSTATQKHSTHDALTAALVDYAEITEMYQHANKLALYDYSDLPF